MKLDFSEIDINLLYGLVLCAISNTQKTMAIQKDTSLTTKTYLRHLKQLYKKLNKLREEPKND